MPPRKAITLRQQRFVDEIMKDPVDQTEAARRAGYTEIGARFAATANMRSPVVIEALRVARADRAKRVRSDGDRIVRELERVALTDLGDIWEPSASNPDLLKLKPLAEWPEDARRAISGMKVKHYEAKTDREGNVIEEPYDVFEFKFWDKPAALKLLGMHHGLRFTERTELTGPNGGPIAVETQSFVIGGQEIHFK